MPTDNLIQGEENRPLAETGDTVIDISESAQEGRLLMTGENDVVVEIPESPDRTANSNQRTVGLVAGFAASIAAAGGAAAAAGLTAALAAADVTTVISDKIAMIANMTGEAAMKVVLAEAAGAAAETGVAETEVEAAIAAEVRSVVGDVEVGEEGIISQAIAAGIAAATPKIKLLADTISGAITAAGPELAAAAETTVKMTEGVILGIVSELGISATLPASAVIGAAAAVVGAAVVAGVGIVVAKKLLAKESTQNPTFSGAMKTVLTGAAITGGVLAATGGSLVETHVAAHSEAAAHAIMVIETVAKNAGTVIANATANLGYTELTKAATVALFRSNLNFENVNHAIKDTIYNLTSNSFLNAKASLIGNSPELPLFNAALGSIMTGASTAGAKMGVATGLATEVAITAGMASAIAVSPALPVIIAAGTTATVGGLLAMGTVALVKRRHVNREQALREDVELNEIRTEYVNHGLERSLATLHTESAEVGIAGSQETSFSSPSPQNDFTDQFASAIVAPIVKAAPPATCQVVKEYQKDLTKQKPSGKKLS